MWRFRIGRAAVLLGVLLGTLPASGQGPALRIVSAAPTGEVGELADAEEIRLVFSEPMVAIGTVPSGAAPPWVRMTPAVPGSFYWSGTSTLIFSPEASRPLPYATRFTVRVDSSASSLSGRRLGAPYELTFTTPTVRLLRAEWYRKTTRYDSPAVIALRFNQRVLPADVASHVRIAMAPHDWTPPQLTPVARERFGRLDATGLAQFDRKVEAASRVAASSDPVKFRLADSWDERRFPPDPSLIVIETTDAPPTDAWLSIVVGSTMPSPEGTATHPEQSTIVRLDPTLFVRGTSCQTRCNPLVYNPISFTLPVKVATLAGAIRVSDVTPADERAVNVEREIPEALTRSLWNAPRLEDLGFPSAPPARTRRITLDPSVEAADGQMLGYSWTTDIDYLHAPLGATFAGEVWEAAGGPSIPVRVRNVSSVNQGTTSVNAREVMPLLQLLRRAGPPRVAAQPYRLTLAPDVVHAHGLDVRALLSARGTGLVNAVLSPRDALPETAEPRGARDPSGALIQVTNLGVTVKDSPESTLVFVTRLDTGAPVAAARVAIVDAANAERWRGTTDEDGVAVAPATSLRQPNQSQALAFVVTAEKDGDIAFVGSDWGTDVHPRFWSVNYQLNEAGSILRGSVFTDRGVYREGEELHVKAMLREDMPAGIALLPAGASLDVLVRDPRGREADRRTLTVKEWSSIDWTWRIPEGASLGTYRVEITRAGVSATVPSTARVLGSFLVAAFRRPDFRVDATLDGTPAVLGAPLKGTVDARYLFGTPMKSRPVRWFVRRTPVQSPPRAIRDRFPDERYAVGYMPSAEDRIRLGAEAPLPQKTDSLGADGRITVDVPTVAGGAVAYSYTFEGDVEGASGPHIANRASLVVHPAALYVALSKPLTFVSTTSGARVGISAVNLNGERVSDVPATVTLFREAWTPVQRPQNPGTITWERREIPSGEWTVRSGAAETPFSIPVPEGGCYTIRATARDAAERETRTEFTFYATGSGVASWRGEGNRIALTPERTTWKPGETARILVQSPWSEATALMTVEREGIRTHRRFRVQSTQDVVEVPITEAYVPNVYVSVVLVRGRSSDVLAPDGTDAGKPSYRVGYTELTVDDASKRLKVDVSSDRQEYRPGQSATVSVSVSAPGGQTPQREVTLWAMDYGLLSLTKYSTPDVLKQIYVRKALQVLTQDNRQRLISRPERLAAAERMQAEGVGQGQGGGTGGGVFQASLAVDALDLRQEVSFTLSGAADEDTGIEIRRDFRPLVFWLGSTTTDAAGRATTTVKLPDSLTTYRIMAVAGDRESLFGFGEREVQVTKPLTLSPSFPRFLNSGDRASFSTVITNTGRAAGEAAVTIHSLNPETLQMTGATKRTITLEAGASEAVSFDALARQRGEARVRVIATMGGDNDAFEVPLRIVAPIRAETTAAYGETTGLATQKLVLPAGVVQDAGGLSVELASTALVGLGEGARYVTEYPYDSAEARASRVLTLLLASDLGGAFRLPGIKPEEYRAEALTALKGLSAYQCGDGGFSDWAGTCPGRSSPYLTAYVLHVLQVAGRLDAPVNPDMLSRGLGFLEQEMRQRPPEVQWWPGWGASQAFAVKVLAEGGRNPAADITRLVGVAERLPVFSLSHLADALTATKDRGPRYQDVVRRLMNAIRIDADRAHVEEIDDAALWWLWSTNTRATAVVLDGISRRGDDSTFVAPLVRWLLSVRSNGRWRTTHENAMVLEALAAYYRAFEKQTPQMTSAVKLGSTTLGIADFKGRSTDSHQMQLSMPELLKQLVSPAQSALTISAAGSGRLYYTTRVQTFGLQPPQAADRGFQVERRFEPFASEGSPRPTTTFNTGDLVRVTVSVTLRGEGTFVALTDSLPAGFEPIDDLFQTTNSELARQATRTTTGNSLLAQWRRGSFNHVERHDDRVIAFATRLGSGRHEFSYLVRATTAGTFSAAGARMEAMYAPELSGRSAAATIVVR